MAVVYKCIPQIKVRTMLNVLVVARHVTSQEEETVMLPEQCIMCKGDKYTKDSYTKKRQREKTLSVRIVIIMIGRRYL